MPDIVIPIPSQALLDEIAAAFKQNYGEPPEGVSDGDWVRRKLLEHIKANVSEVRVKAQRTSEKSIRDSVSTELGDI